MDTTNPHILVVDDDREIRDLLTKFMMRHGLRVSAAKDGVEMMKVLDERRIDLVVLDLMLPGDDGLTLCRRMRETRSGVPIIMLTAMGEDTDRIVGLEMGADDYVAKPFNPRELLARIKAVLRRTQGTDETAPGRSGTKVSFLGWTLDLASRDLLSPDGVMVALSAGEFGLLQVFVEHPRRVLSRDQLLDFARGRSAVPFDRSIDIQVSRLRRRICDDARDPQIIKTVRGGGYLFTPEVERS
ncbi:response regulator [Magnetospirillum sp. 15-1]|uniref:response regulator n=1 Tax=Magnetospirillum sp. 15-1 TaxID=1979370 RepID=UPI000BBC530B|nr:response regulator [Magnetospirillum sp. 15-1]